MLKSFVSAYTLYLFGVEKMPGEQEFLTLEPGENSQKQAICDLIGGAKAVFFDHDDTLVEAMKAKWAQHKYIARKFYGKKLTDDELRVHWGAPLSSLLKLLYGTHHLDIAMSYNIAIRDRFPKLLFKDTLSTMKFLRKAGKKVGIVTATSLSSLQNDFETLGISKQLFDYIQTEDDTIFHKPDPRVFEPTLQWLAKHRIRPSEVVYVGDHLKDLIAAKGAGLHFIGVSTGVISAAEFAKHRALHVPSLASLLV